MGDISELRGLIFTVSFLGGLVLLLTWAPGEIFTAGEYRTVEPQYEFEGIDIYSFADTSNNQLNESGGWYYPLDANWYIVEIHDAGGSDFGGHDLDMWYKINGSAPYEIRHEHLYGFFIFVFSHFMDHYDRSGVNRGSFLSFQEIEDNRESDNCTSIFKIQCDDFYAKSIFYYNGTAYNNFTHAHENEELFVFHGINFDQEGTSYNAFDLIGRLLFFSLPGINIYVNALIAIPFWICITYIVVILIYRTIGALFGGGA